MEEKAILEACPACGSPLENGYIVSRMISWSDKKIGFWSFKRGEKIVSGGLSLFPAKCRSLPMKKCKLIIFRYGETKQE
jgi:hypothetical protein